MTKNMGAVDRTIRILITVVIAVLFFSHVISGTWAYVLLAIAAIFLLTSFVSVCPLYSVFGIDTCKTKKA